MTRMHAYGVNMNDHVKKMIAPIVITVIAVAYFIVYFTVIIFSTEDFVFKMLMGIVPAVLAVLMIAVCIQRIREIREGEEDDLGKY